VSAGASTRKSELSSSASITERLRRGDTTVGTFLNLGSPLAAEICARAGFDWVLLDLEHGAGTEAELIPSLQAVAGRCAFLVRVEQNERPRFQRALDAGADGVMVPRVDSVEHARDAVAHLRYPPVGDRGVAYMNRAAGFGAETGERDVLCVIQVETRTAVEQAGELAELDGVDVLFVGPADLGAAIGRDAVPEATDAVLRACEAAGKAAGLFTRERADAEAALGRGFRFVALASDSYFLAQAARAAAGGLRGSEPQSPS
jgi:2-dehydro-3-deoxyglucarate aldolase/4-hydroxy-2-oxoheptanedioate aldolase